MYICVYKCTCLSTITQYLLFFSSLRQCDGDGSICIRIFQWQLIKGCLHLAHEQHESFCQMWWTSLIMCCFFLNDLFRKCCLDYLHGLVILRKFTVIDCAQHTNSISKEKKIKFKQFPQFKCTRIRNEAVRFDKANSIHCMYGRAFERSSILKMLCTHTLQQFDEKSRYILT